MKRFIFIVLIFLSFGSFAQNVKSWQEGPLQWSDFKKVSQQSDTSSMAYFGWEYETKVVKDGKFSYKYTDVHSLFNRDYSWVKEECMIPEELAVNQAIFDLAERYAHEYRDSLLFSKLDLKEVEKHYNSAINSALLEYRNRSAVPEALTAEEDFDVTKVKWDYSKSGFAFGFNAGVIAPVSALNSICSPVINIVAEGNYVIGRNMILLELCYGESIMKENGGSALYITGHSGENKLSPYIGYGLKYGFSFIDNPGLRLSAAAGIGYSFREFMEMNIGKSDAVAIIRFVKGPMLSEGIYADVKLRNWVGFNKPNPLSSESSVRLRLYVDEVWNSEQKYFFPQINLSVGFNMFNRRIVRR